jgi:1-acyl-sn-glycerol-3-phosphate acyltransferase
MSHLRGLARAAGFVAWTLAVGGAWLAFLAAARPFVSGDLRQRGGAWTLSLWSRGLCRLLGLRVSTRGPIPRSGPCLIVSNHIGYLDVIALSSVTRALFVSKEDLARWPVMGPLGKSVGTLFLDRARPRAVAEVAAGLRRAFAAGASVIVFPEGTTTRGDTVEEFHTALFEPALRAPVPVRGTLLAYARRCVADPEDMAAWTGNASFVPHLYRLFRGRGLDVRIVFQAAGETSGRRRETDRRVVAAGVRAWMLREQRGDFLFPDLVAELPVEAQIGDGLERPDGLEDVDRDVFVKRPVVGV